MSFSKKELQDIFRGYRGIDKRIYKQLKMLGFEIARERNHCVLSYAVNRKVLHFTCSKTGSDWRAGLNLASCIYNTICMETENVA